MPIIQTMHPLFDKFLQHNHFWESVNKFNELDPHLRRIKGLPYIFHSPLLEEIPLKTPGIYLVDGGRQVGKTTLIKQLIRQSFKNNLFQPDHVLFLSGELIRTDEELRKILDLFLQSKKERVFIAIDEVNYIPDWDRIIKYMADDGSFEKATVILTGSNHVIIKDAMKRFPGRRGKADKTNFHYYPLSFKEFIYLRHSKPLSIEKLYDEFTIYLQTGGYLTAINEMAQTGKISMATLTTYKEWVFGDFSTYQKSEKYLTEILRGIFKCYGSQVSWNAFSRELSIDHHKTVADYCGLLAEMDAAYIQHALLADKLIAAPKKPKKIYFNDPFIFHALHASVFQPESAWEENIKPILEASYVSTLIEGIVVTHFRRYFPTYYLEDKQEIDVACVRKQKIFPVEVKWTNQLRFDEWKFLKKYPHTVIAAKVKEEINQNGCRILPLPQVLLECETLEWINHD